MERLKFKIWDKKNKRFLIKCIDNIGINDKQSIDTNEFKNNVFSYLDWENGSIKLNSKKYIVLQYIGLKDMKGKEIFRNDSNSTRGGFTGISYYMVTGGTVSEFSEQSLCHKGIQGNKTNGGSTYWRKCLYNRKTGKDK